MAERTTEKLFLKHFDPKNEQIWLEQKEISKKGFIFISKTSKAKPLGIPEFLIETNDKVIVAECKRNPLEHESKDSKNPARYAVDGIKHYMMNNNIDDKDIIGIALSGIENDYRIDYYLKITNNKNIIDLNIKTFISLNELNSIAEKTIAKVNYEHLIKYADKINTIFDQVFKIPVEDRPYFFAALLFAMPSLSAFSIDYKERKIKVKGREKLWDELSEREKVDYINEIISAEVAKAFVGKVTNSFKTVVPAKFSFIESSNYYIKSDDYITFLIGGRIDLNESKTESLPGFINLFSEYKKTSKYYDIIGSFYSEFLRYVQKAGGQDIVLTPDHIKTFMANLINIQKDDVILDTCTGSGGFIATTFGKILGKLDEEGLRNIGTEKNVREKQLIAVESNPNMFALAFSNMILHGDGKSNLYVGNSFENFDIELEEKTLKFEDVIRDLKPTKGIINPPYNDDAAPSFILRLLNLLKMGNGKSAVVIAPANALIKKTELTKKILDNNTLKTIIRMDNCFKNQNININPAIFVFNVGEKHRVDDKVYFYNFEDDGYRYTKRKMEDMGKHEQLANETLINIRDKKIIDGVSYLDNINLETFEDVLYIPRVNKDLTLKNFVETIVDYLIYQIKEEVL